MVIGSHPKRYPTNCGAIRLRMRFRFLRILFGKDNSSPPIAMRSVGNYLVFALLARMQGLFHDVRRFRTLFSGTPLVSISCKPLNVGDGQGLKSVWFLFRVSAAGIQAGRPNRESFRRGLPGSVGWQTSMAVPFETIIASHAGEIPGLEDIDFSGFIPTVLDHHARTVAAGGSHLRKDAPESAVTIVEMEHGPTLCVKEFRWRGLAHALKGIFRPTQGARTFRNGWRLHEEGVGAALPLALIRSKSKGLVSAEWVVMEVIPGGLELDRYILERVRLPWNTNDRRCFIRMFGRFIGSLHAKGIVHSDLKTCNVVVAQSQTGQPENDRGFSANHEGPSSGLSQVPTVFGGTGENNDSSSHEMPPQGTGSSRQVSFFLLDYDEVRFSHDIPMKKRVKNLVQIFLSTPAAIGASDRLCFLREYALHAGLNRKETRTLCRKIVDAAKGKEILYVGFSGDIVEQWETELEEGPSGVT